MKFGEVRRAQLAKFTLLTPALLPLGSFKVCSDAKERVGCREQREVTAPIQSLVELQPWFLSFWWKTCLRQKLQRSFLRLQWRTCPWTELSDAVVGKDQITTFAKKLNSE